MIFDRLTSMDEHGYLDKKNSEKTKNKFSYGNHKNCIHNFHFFAQHQPFKHLKDHIPNKSTLHTKFHAITSPKTFFFSKKKNPPEIFSNLLGDSRTVCAV
jgi:hypothetical protein